MRRFAQSFSPDSAFPDTLDRDVVDALAALPDRYNIAVRKSAAVLVEDAGRLAVREMQWGIVPRWSRTPDTKYTTMTARLERVARNRIYRHAWEAGQRCVVPMTGYYKWERTGGRPRPWFIQARSGAVLAVAGLWERWDKGEAPLDAFTVLTHPNAAIPPPLFPDGPVFLPAGRWREWLTGAQWLPKRFLATLPPPALEAYRVSPAIRDPARDDYTLLEPADPLDTTPEPEWDESLDDEALDDGD